MSIEYTIDIQLTELGFPDILQPSETSVREAPSDDSFSPSHSPTSLSATHKQKLLVRGQRSVAGAAKQTSSSKQSTSPQSETSPRKPLSAAQSPQGEGAVEDTALSEATADLTAGPETANRLLDRTTEQDDSGEVDVDSGHAAQEDSTKMQQDVEDESDDSEVSEVYEEEEADEDEDEDEEDEEGQNNGMTQ